ncbi:hypothetical protein H7U37_03895 [Pseudoflavonifractor phocaeensis]|uniref:hypothetical protein n=1 Tax=Pseudoflavonifractor phocaeensis TaxID=1870988 RepID=UPI00195E08E9|nr:hypothetical protein [Pseudoflavonifractor phocaeensis]MBM6869474.1 hypothetical protein [Pseudoflavonifractor phocaeensis]MBM6937675.1 hypothetical protein [Pseudoflavonifractor phocaeensis]
MNSHPFLGGIGLGMMAGALLGMAAAPRGKDLKRTAKRAMRSMEHMASELGSTMGL